MYTFLFSVMLTFVYLANKLGSWIDKVPMEQSTETWWLTMIIASLLLTVAVLDIRYRN